MYMANNKYKRDNANQVEHSPIIDGLLIISPCYIFACKTAGKYELTAVADTVATSHTATLATYTHT